MTVIYDTQGKIIMYSEHTMDAGEKAAVLESFPEAVAGDWESCDKDRQYVDVAQGTLVERPEFEITCTQETIPADGETPAVIEGIPAGARVTTGAETLEADGTPLEFITDIPGEHSIRIECFPYLPEEVTIHAA